MASLTPDRKPCALLESAYFLLAYSYILCMGGRCQRVICARTKNKVCFIAWVFPLDARTITYLSCLLSFYRTNQSYVCCCVCFAKLECQLIFLGIEIYHSNLSQQYRRPYNFVLASSISRGSFSHIDTLLMLLIKFHHLSSMFS